MDYFEEIKINNFLKTIENIEGNGNIKLKKIFNNIDKQKIEKIFLNKKITINLFKALFRKINNSSIWSNANLNFISKLVEDLHKLKEIYKFDINPYLILYYCKLENLVDLNIYFNKKNIKIENIHNYLYSLPGYIPNITNKSQLPISTFENHGFLVIEIVEILNKLIEIYNYKEGKNNYKIQTWNLIRNLENF
tara:strand:+ start:1411 stop:1989 length:579 start_codon:yes stop_codon:yes gene_type:complete